MRKLVLHAMNDKNLVSTPITDKNGKQTTVHKRSGEPDKNKNKRVSGAPLPTSSRDASEKELRDEVESDLSKVSAELALLDAEVAKIQAKRAPLVNQRNSLFELKMELEAGDVTHESPIEDIKRLNQYGTRSTQAYRNEESWVKALHPQIRTFGYDEELNVPVASISLDYNFEDTQGLADGLMKFVNAVADGRDEVPVTLMAADVGMNSYEIMIDPKTGESVVNSNGSRAYWKFSGTKPLKETLDWVTKNLPMTYPDSKRESLYPEQFDIYS